MTSLRTLSMILLMLVLVAFDGIAQVAPAQKTIEELAQQVERDASAECGGRWMLLSYMAARPDFQTLHPRRQAMLLMRLAICADEAGSSAAALDYAQRAAALDPQSASAQGMRMTFSMDAGKPREAVESLEALARLRPDFIRGMDADRLNYLVVEADRADPSGESALKAFDALQRLDWSPGDSQAGDSLRVMHARLLLDRGRPDEARSRLVAVLDPQQVVAIRADRRFDALRKDAEFEALLDVESAVERAVSKARHAMNGDPPLLWDAYAYMGALVVANRYEEALKEANSILDRTAANHSAYRDAGEMGGWIRLMASMLSYETGRADEGRRIYESLIAEPGGDGLRGSAQMGLANFLVMEGRGEDALAVLSDIGDMSPHGRAWAEAIRVCAGTLVDDALTVVKSLDYVRAHEFDHVGALPHALVCVGDLDELSRVVVERLANPSTRAAMLTALQVRPEIPSDTLDYMKVIAQRESGLRAREDVRRAVDAVGRIEAVPARVPGIF